jgi:O-succinylhomoserine sulfhydrylase
MAEERFKGLKPGFIYSRYSNPTVAMFEERMAMLEGAEAARATASGMAAVTAAVMGQVRAGDHVVAARALFGSCLYVIEDLLPRFGVATTLVDGADLGQWRAAMRPETKVCFLESPTNPCLAVYDLAAIAAIAHERGATLVVDNVFATPLLQRPMEFGADVVIYSATKHVDGHGRCLGGILLTSQALMDQHFHNYLRQTGPALSPFNAWVMLKSLESLPVRVAHQTKNAGIIADFLAGQPGIARVIYPGRADHPQAELARRQMSGGSTLVTFEVVGGKAGAFRFANALSIIMISNNLGDAKSIITHPATTTHQRLTSEARAAMGISDGMLRLSVGLEDVDDLVEDLAVGLDARVGQDLAAE